MKSSVAALFAVAGALALSSMANGAESFVECPVQELDSAVTTSLPKGWWATPQTGELLGTEVSPVAGRPVLVCKYRGFGGSISVMRNLPGGFASCKATQGGFRCISSGAAEGDGSVRTDPQMATQTSSNAKIPVKGTNDAATTATQVQVEAPVVSKDGVDSGKLATQAEFEASKDVKKKNSPPAPTSK